MDHYYHRQLVVIIAFDRHLLQSHTMDWRRRFYYWSILIALGVVDVAIAATYYHSIADPDPRHLTAAPCPPLKEIIFLSINLGI